MTLTTEQAEIVRRFVAGESVDTIAAALEAFEDIIESALRAALRERDEEIERLYATAQAVLHQLDHGEASDLMEESSDLRFCREQVRSICAP